MALNPSSAYPSQTSTTDPVGYPYGRAKNVAAIGDGTGTPLEEQWVSDLFGLQQALLTEVGVVPSGIPDKVGASQYLGAFKAISRREIQRAQAQNWPERSSFTGPSVSLDCLIGIGYAPDLGVSGSGMWVIQTSGTDVWTSEDGRLWTSRGAPTSASFTNPWIAYGKINGVSGFLLSQNGNPSVYYTSTDGITWTPISTTAVPAHQVSAYSASLGLWVMAGDSGAVRTSPTGLANTWTARTTPGPWQAAMVSARSIVWNGSLFVVLPVASYNKVLTSPDGITWTERTLPVSQSWVGLAYGAADGIWMANGHSGSVATSPDGITWAPVTSALGVDLAVNGYVWVIPTLNGSFGGILWSTDKGTTWNRSSVGNHRDAVLGWNRILAADGRFMVAHGVSGGVAEIAMSQRALP